MGGQTNMRRGGGEAAFESGEAKRTEILDYIRAHIKRFGYPPALREMGKAVSLSSMSTLHYHLQILEEQGKIKRNPAMNRAIALVDAEPSCCPHCGGALTPEAADV